MNFDERFEHLAERARETDRTYRDRVFADSPETMSDVRRAAWCRVLTSAANSEFLEEVLLAPVAEAFRGDRAAAGYLGTHGRDEQRHGDLLRRYVKETFWQERRGSGVFTRLLYGALMPAVSRLFRSRPLYGCALMFAYEKFSLTFYREAAGAAQADGADALVQLLQTIGRDEAHHLAGVELLMRRLLARGRRPGRADRGAIRAILGLVVLDTDFRPWALHNRGFRAHLDVLGIDPSRISRAARTAAEETIDRIESLGRPGPALRPAFAAE